MIKGIIFDLDGTTLNTLYDIQDSINLSLKENGYSIKTYDEVRMAVGKGSRNLVRDCLPKNTDEKEIDRLLKVYSETYKKNYAIRTIPYEGIKEVLEELNNKNILLAVNSNKPDELTKSLIKIHFPNIKFVCVYGAIDGIPHKPDPTLANRIINEMKLNKEEVLYIGDSDTDMKTANNAGLKSIGCEWGFRDKKTLEENNATYIIKNPKEILNYL